ncbi:hypothetical protein BGZ95_007636, partial [Linnemannia exigua]
DFQLNRAARRIAQGGNYHERFAVAGGFMNIWWERWFDNLASPSEAEILDAVKVAINEVHSGMSGHGFVQVGQSKDCVPIGGLGWLYDPDVVSRAAPLPSWTLNNTYVVAPFVVAPKSKFERSPLRTPPVNANAKALCKREAIYKPLYKCAGPSTLLPGQRMTAGESRWSNQNTEMRVENDGNLCLYYHNPNSNNYWCANWAKSVGDFHWQFTDDGVLCRWDSKGGLCMPYDTNNFDRNYRLTIQEDGNLVAYRGAGLGNPIWSSGTVILRRKVSSPCW